MTKYSIPVILGTGREGRVSERVAKLVVEQARQAGFEAELVDVRDFPFGFTSRVNETALRWKAIAARSHGFIIVSPEYNHGYPGELKLLLDSAYEEYRGKPAVVCGVSDGPFGGARMIEGLRTALIGMQLVPLWTAAMVPFADKAFDEQGKPLDPALTDRLARLCSSLKEHLEQRTPVA